MSDIEQQIREYAAKLLASGQVDLVIGYGSEQEPLRTGPCFAREPGDVEQFVWNPLCENNLARYVAGRKERVAVIAKGCDARSIVVLVNEKQVERKNVKIIGVGCGGIVDRKKVKARVGERDVEKAEWKDGKLVVHGAGFSDTLDLDAIAHDSCLACEYRDPIVCDVMIGVKAGPRDDKGARDPVEIFEAKTPEERWAYLSEEFSKCIRCYACRNACPLCYCRECCVEQTFPKWIGQTENLSETMAFHLVRALHTAGRCVDCGACARACPNNIDLRLLTGKAAKDVKNLFGSEAGLSLDEKSAMISFAEEDPQDFIK